MLSEKMITEQRAISNLVATLILIAVAVVGGAFAYTAFRNQAQTSTTSADLQVQDLTVERVGGSSFASATVKNVGTQRLSNVTVTVNPAKPADNKITLDSTDGFATAIDPGVTDHAYQKGTDGANDNLVAGTVYPVRISASTPDGGSIAKTTTVRVES